MVSVLQKILGDPNDKALKRLGTVKDRVNAVKPDIERLSSEELARKTDEFRRRLSDGEALDSILPEAFATVRESARRNLGQQHYDVQIIGGAALHQGKIAEMRTGEGKTLVATLAAYANALSGRGVHVVTVNDYLARRDPAWMGPVYSALGLTVGCLQQDSAFVYDSEVTGGNTPGLRAVSRQEAYLADITYGTNNAFGFDYLRDNMTPSLNGRAQRELHYAIVDEVDNILIDEARTPLIISGPAEEPVQLYQNFARLVPRLNPAEDYTIDDRTQAVSLSQEGIAKMEQWTNTSNMYDPENYHLVHYVENALNAHVMKHRDKDYVVQNGEVIIVDEFTGRLQPGRRWSDGLHQAVEAKEGIKVQRETVTYATITLQNYFRMYDKLAGMTGTASTEADEFFRIYGLEVVEVPTNKPMLRDDMSDLVYQSTDGKWDAVTERIAELHQSQQPLLIGTTSIEDSEYLSDMLRRRGVRHQVLNAKNHEGEANVIAQAGRLGAVTVSTNMAGRGTDIVLGGADSSAEGWQEEHDRVVELGGLFVIGTEHHDARRIDNQLRGRAGRQGDPGRSQFYVSLEDELLQRFGGDRIKAVMGWSGLKDDTPLENNLVTKSISGAQVKVEGYHYDMRKHLLEFDDVLNKQREVIYADRMGAQDGKGLRNKMVDMLRLEYAGLLDSYLPSRQSDDWQAQGMITELGSIGPIPESLDSEGSVLQRSREEISGILDEHAEKALAQREEELGLEHLELLSQFLLLRAIDAHWVQHLTAMENLRTGIGLHAYGQRNPLVMYQSEGQKMFRELQETIRRNVIRQVFHLSIDTRQVPSQAASNRNARPMRQSGSPTRVSERAGAASSKVGRNATCPCGSGRKYKRCCGRAA